MLRGAGDADPEVWRRVRVRASSDGQRDGLPLHLDLCAGGEDVLPGHHDAHLGPVRRRLLPCLRKPRAGQEARRGFCLL